MSQSIHFAHIECFSDSFLDQLEYRQVLSYLKKIIEPEPGKKVDKTLDDNFIKGIETEYLSLSAYGELEPFLESGSEVQLHSESRYYFVVPELWDELEKKILKEFQDEQDTKDSLLAKDLSNIKNFYEKKKLVFEAS